MITYLLLSGDLPFMGRTQKELFQNIVRGEKTTAMVCSKHDVLLQYFNIQILSHCHPIVHFR